LNPDLQRRWLDSVPWAMLAVGSDLAIAAANDAAAKLLRAAGPGDLHGRNLSRLCRVEPHGWMEATVREVASGVRGQRPLVLRAICGDLPEDAPAIPLRIHVLPFPSEQPSLVTVVLETLPATEDEDRADVLIERFLQIASHVRHEINNPLMGVLVHGELLESRTDLPEDVRERIRAIREEAERIREHVRELGAIRRDPT
jgi:signal transduction histidine kinase